MCERNHQANGIGMHRSPICPSQVGDARSARARFGRSARRRRISARSWLLVTGSRWVTLQHRLRLGLGSSAGSSSRSACVAQQPLERAVFLLREVFDYPYDEIAGIVDKNEANCRQVFSRARRRIDEGRTRFTSSSAERDELALRFRGAAERGSVDELIELLAADAAFYGDGGGKARAVAAPVFGGERVARVVAGFFTRFAAIGATFQPSMVNGQAGLLAFDSDLRLINVFVLDISDGKIQTIRSVINPDKLEHLGLPLSDVARIDIP